MAKHGTLLLIALKLVFLLGANQHLGFDADTSLATVVLRHGIS